MFRLPYLPLLEVSSDSVSCSLVLIQSCLKVTKDDFVIQYQLFVFFTVVLNRVNMSNNTVDMEIPDNWSRDVPSSITTTSGDVV